MTKRRRTRQQRQLATVELPPRLYNDVKAVALRLALAGLIEDELTRQTAVRTQLLELCSASPGLLIGVVGWLLAQFTDGLIRSHGGPTGAADEITAELAAAVLAESGGQP